MSGANAEPLLMRASFAELLSQVADTVGLGAVATDANLVIRGWNRWMEAAAGRSAHDVVGRRLLDVFPGIAGTDGEIGFQQALAGESVVFAHRFHEYLLPLPPPVGLTDLQYMQQSARIVPLADAGMTVGTVALIEDVSERVVRERDLRTAKEAAETANEAKSDFLAAMSHELRTPLTAILGYADLLDSEVAGSLNENQRAHVHRIVTGAWHLISIIEEILSFSRIEAHKYDIVLDHADVVAIARESVALLEQQAEQKGLELRTILPPSKLVVSTDAQKVRQILLNIVGNAVKYTDAGSVTLEVAEEPQHVRFTVQDTGPGIPDQYRDRIFEPFMQIDQSKTRRKGGTGLGLPLSRSLAELVGGTLVLEAHGPPGAAFTLRLPNEAGE